MKTKYTPGPWSTFKGYGSHPDLPIFIDAGKTKQESLPICQINQTVDTTTEMAKANARLIASAPELLEALKEAFNYLSQENGKRVKYETDSLLDTLERAIFKATGEESK